MGWGLLGQPAASIARRRHAAIVRGMRLGARNALIACPPGNIALVRGSNRCVSRGGVERRKNADQTAASGKTDHVHFKSPRSLSFIR